MDRRKQKRTYDKEFKLMIIDLVNTGKSSYELGEEFDIDPSTVRRWNREHNKFNEGSFSGKGVPNLTPEEKEIVHLKKALADSKLETEILKKAISIFSKKGETNSSL